MNTESTGRKFKLTADPPVGIIKRVKFSNNFQDMIRLATGWKRDEGFSNIVFYQWNPSTQRYEVMP